MGRRSFDVVDLLELFTHWEAGRSQSQIAASLNLDRKTVRKYMAPLVAQGLVPGGPPAGEQVWAQRIADWFPEVTDRRLRQLTWPEIETHRDYIVEQLGEDVTVATISQRLTDEQRLGGVGIVAAPVAEREPGRGRRSPQGVATAAAGRAGQRGADRLRQPGVVGRPGHRPPADGLGVRDGAGLFPADVRAPGAAVGPDLLVRKSCRSHSTTFRGARPASSRTT